jgi:hypothetical protein
VVEIVVAFTKRDYRSDGVITGSVLVVERRISKPVGQGIDAKCRVGDKDKTSSTGVYISPTPIAPKQTRNDSGESKTHEEDEPDIPPVLPSDHLILAQVRDVRNAGSAPGLHDHPANVGPQEAAMSIVGVKIGICVPVMRAVSAGPPFYRTFHSTGTSGSKKILQWLGRIV